MDDELDELIECALTFDEWASLCAGAELAYDNLIEDAKKRGQLQEFLVSLIKIASGKINKQVHMHMELRNGGI